MTESSLAASPTATPLSAWLASTASQLAVAPYRGVFTPIEFDVRARELEALFSGAALHDLGWLRRVEVRGEDRFRWLSGMVTNMVNDLPLDGGAWNLVLNAQGRVQGDLFVWRNGDALEMEIAADQIGALLSHLERFIIMDDVELAAKDSITAVGVTGPRAGEVLERLGLPVLKDPLLQVRVEWNGMNVRVRRTYGALGDHYELWTSTATLHKLWKFLTAGGAKPVGSAALEAFRIAEGIPVYGVDMVDRDLPQETSQARTLCFNKGCYLGQEIVERIHSRGNVHRHLRQLELDGALPPAGTELMAEGGAAGHITSAAELPLDAGARRIALGVIKAEAELGNQLLTYTAGETTGTARLLSGPPSF